MSRKVKLSVLGTRKDAKFYVSSNTIKFCGLRGAKLAKNINFQVRK